jgi:hypothetical protein
VQETEEQMNRILQEEEESWQHIGLVWTQAKVMLDNPPRQGRSRTRPQFYQSEEEQLREERLRRQARGRERPGKAEAPTESTEEESHDWKEGERMGEAQNPGPSVGRAKGGPWGQERRKPGQAPQAQQAWGGSRPHQTRQKPVKRTYREDAKGWTTVRGTAKSTSTRSSTHTPRRGSLRESTTGSLIMRPPVGGNHTKPLNPNFNNSNSMGACWFGQGCKYAFCPYQHPASWWGNKQRVQPMPAAGGNAAWGGRGRPSGEPGVCKYGMACWWRPPPAHSPTPW